MTTKRTPRSALLAALALMVPAGAAVAQNEDYYEQERQKLLSRLNDDDTVKGTEASKSYRLLFDAYLAMSKPPFNISPRFNHTTIWPGMKDWAAVSDWAESNPGMAKAILACTETNILGLPYGAGEVEPKYHEAELHAALVPGELRFEFTYLYGIDVIAAYATAEMYRLFEARQAGNALELAVAFNWVARQMCDREFLDEKLYSIQLLIDALSNLRDGMYMYMDQIEASEFRSLAWYDLPGLRPDRNRLHIPEGDRVFSEALLKAVFDERSHHPDPDKFAEAFAAIQSADAPLTRFGAARRWRMIALVHDSLEASLERLALIYDDWWRRWRVQEYDTILDTETQFERTNPVRYAAVIYSMQDLADVFSVRNQLITAVNGTAVAAGLCAYVRTYGNYPDDKEKTYGQFVRKLISDIDPYDQGYGRLRYRYLAQPDTVDTHLGRVKIEKGQGVLYSRGVDHADNRAAEHTPDGTSGDLVLWPPIKALLREQKMID